MLNSVYVLIWWFLNWLLHYRYHYHWMEMFTWHWHWYSFGISGVVASLVIIHWFTSWYCCCSFVANCDSFFMIYGHWSQIIGLHHSNANSFQIFQSEFLFRFQWRFWVTNGKGNGDTVIPVKTCSSLGWPGSSDQKWTLVWGYAHVTERQKV